MNPASPIPAASSCFLLNPKGEKFVKANRQFEGIPGIEVTPSGRLWATWYSGGDNEGPENYVLLVTSDDGGQTWSDLKAAVDPAGEERAFDPGLWIDPLGRLWWYWNQSMAHPENPCYDGRVGVWIAICENPDADNPSWSAPRRIANGIMMNKPTVTSDGTWLFPAAVWSTTKPKLEALEAEQFSNVIASSDQGATFYLQGSADIPQRTYDEHMVVERKDHSLWMIVRTSYGYGESFSTDGGRSWSEGKPSQLQGPNSRAFLRRLASGRLLFVGHAGNPSDKSDAGPGGFWAGRSHLTAWLSEDDGTTWIGGLLLDERKNISYPDGAQDAEGNIHIIYDRERLKDRDILLAKFTEAEILNGAFSAPQSFLQRSIVA